MFVLLFAVSVILAFGLAFAFLLYSGE